jgi:arylsulfatase
MAVYAAQIDRVDQGIGRIVAALEKAGRRDNTLIMFLADNGGCAEVIRMPGAARFAHTGQATAQWGTRPDVSPGGPETFASYGIGWANASNTPFRLYKHFVHEGGIATPLIVHWPRGIRDRGTLRHQPGHVIDLMATCIDVAGVVYPTMHDGHAITPFAGKSLRPAFAGEDIERAAIFWEHEGNRAVRVGRWKLVARGVRGRWELYDLHADRSETTDLAAAQPDRVAKMATRWEAWARRARVKPWPRQG